VGNPPAGGAGRPARALSALSQGDFEAAYRHAIIITRPGELTDHVPHALWMTKFHASFAGDLPAGQAASWPTPRSAGA
jgi:hypothetical protein